MKEVIERRIVRQEWYETEFTKSGWDNTGWVFDDDGIEMPYTWTIVEHLLIDKHYNPLIGVAEKTVII